MTNRESNIDQISLEMEYSGLVSPAMLSWIIEAHEVVIADVAEELGGTDLRAKFDGKIAGFAAIMKSIDALEDIYPNISPYISGRAKEQMGVDQLI